MFERQAVVLILCTFVAYKFVASDVEFSKGDGPVFRDYLNISDIEYYISTGSLLWADAYNDCLYRNMKLISFENPGEFKEVSDHLSTMGSYNWRWYWTSGMKERMLVNGTWHWMPSQNEITEFFWLSGEPNLNLTFDACLSFRPDFGGMDDDDCVYNTLGHICEPLSN